MSVTARRLGTASLVISLTVVLCSSFVLADDCKHQGQQNNYTFGQLTYRDRLFYTDRVSLKSKWLRVNTVDVTYPKQGSPVFGTIAAIVVTDLRKDGTGGCTYLANGGPGQSQVTIHFKTQRNHGLDFQVQIYGH